MACCRDRRTDGQMSLAILCVSVSVCLFVCVGSALVGAVLHHRTGSNRMDPNDDNRWKTATPQQQQQQQHNPPLPTHLSIVC